MRIKRISETRENKHVLPPGPKGESIEDVLEIAEKQMEEASQNAAHQELVKKKAEEITQPPNALAQRGVLPQMEAKGKDLGGPMAHASLGCKVLGCLILVVTGKKDENNGMQHKVHSLTSLYHK